jgi:hypothetical protein
MHTSGLLPGVPALLQRRFTGHPGDNFGDRMKRSADLQIDSVRRLHSAWNGGGFQPSSLDLRERLKGLSLPTLLLMPTLNASTPLMIDRL